MVKQKNNKNSASKRSAASNSSFADNRLNAPPAGGAAEAEICLNVTDRQAAVLNSYLVAKFRIFNEADMKQQGNRQISYLKQKARLEQTIQRSKEQYQLQ